MSPVGGQGEFYFENLPPGSYPALVEDKDGACSFMLTMPKADTPIVSLGTIRCLEARP